MANETKVKIKWNEKDILFLKENYSKLQVNEICNFLNRSKRAIYGQAFKLNLKYGRKNDRNSNWKGNSVGMEGLHKYIRKLKPKPLLCGHCKKVKPCDLANISGEYKRDITDFIWLCRSCHKKYDNINKKGENSPFWKVGKTICKDCNKRTKSWKAVRCWKCYIKKIK